MGWFGSLRQAADDLSSLTKRPSVRNFVGKIKPDADGGDPHFDLVKGDKFSAERSYFSVRIAEMRLAEAGRYFIDFTPMCSCFLRYSYGKTQRTVPFVLGSDYIKNGLGKDAAGDAGRNIQFQDIYVVRNCPVKADNLLMYSALCRFKDSGFARGLLDLLADAAGTVGGPVAGAMAGAGVDLTKRLGTLLGSDGVETRFGVLNGSALDESGYRIFAGVDSQALNASELTMRNGQIRRKEGDSDVAVDGIDYLVIALEHRPSIVDLGFSQVAILPFHARFDEARTKLMMNDKEGAASAMRGLIVELITSPDLTEADRIALITAYRGAYDQWENIGKPATMAGSAAPSMTRKLLSASSGADQTVAALLHSTLRATLKADQQAAVSGLEDPAGVLRALAARAVETSAALAQGSAALSDLQSVSRTIVPAALALN